MLQRLVDAAAVSAEIERVRSLSGNALRRRWQAEFGRAAPKSLTADLLRRMIANSVQEQAFGTLDRATLKMLDGLARRDGARRSERNLKIGTVLVRDYQGRRHTVTVGHDGFVWEGVSYSSLSAIARGRVTRIWDPQGIAEWWKLPLFSAQFPKLASREFFAASREILGLNREVSTASRRKLDRANFRPRIGN
jgi:hypothetical protein